MRWNEKNFESKRRVVEMGGKTETESDKKALAIVIHQPIERDSDLEPELSFGIFFWFNVNFCPVAYSFGIPAKPAK